MPPGFPDFEFKLPDNPSSTPPPIPGIFPGLLAGLFPGMIQVKIEKLPPLITCLTNFGKPEDYYGIPGENVVKELSGKIPEIRKREKQLLEKVADLRERMMEAKAPPTTEQMEELGKLLSMAAELEYVESTIRRVLSLVN